MVEKVLAVIPARHGSKGVKGKNYRDFNNKPLITWTMEIVKSLKYIDYSVISSNCKYIQKIASEKKFNFIKRPQALSSDTSRTEESILHTVNQLKKRNLTFDYIFIFEPTSPLRKVSTINRAFNFLKKEKINSLMTVTKIDKFIGKIKSNKFLSLLPETKRRRQERESFFSEVGVIYIIRYDYFLKTKKIVNKNTFPFEVDEIESFDINNNEDFLLAEIFHSEFILKKNKKIK